ncbi:hypothetical protein PPSIR1_01729 [Plesiocystis pacifica SIR-1]|uniref:Uncharacterized protein n=1 Tax=Plesiocystis pacifica SIR-1 TaxID=391625 RepID=A6G858_9BACT|nr:hypothetical protein [Plesiocystis pacifica]EDM77899.1 hypothetical protein PPSIR1_01729 [Plesiocystis pacifica SIR-1]
MLKAEKNGAERTRRLERVLRVEWLGQTVASLCWIVSVFVYGVSETGDWLQLAAASAWLVANVAAIASVEAD